MNTVLVLVTGLVSHVVLYEGSWWEIIVVLYGLWSQFLRGKRCGCLGSGSLVRCLEFPSAWMDVHLPLGTFAAETSERLAKTANERRLSDIFMAEG
jgi:hypothetical protein